MCELCGASFARRQKMKSHVATVHEGKKPHQCSICNACFSSKHNMTCHIASAHEKKKPYKCLQCSDSFSRKENLETHVISIHWFTLIKHRNEAFCDQHFLVVTIRAHDPSLYFSWCISGYGELLKRNKLKNVEKNKWMDWALFFSIWCTSVCPPNPPCSYLWTKK